MSCLHHTQARSPSLPAGQVSPRLLQASLSKESLEACPKQSMHAFRGQSGEGKGSSLLL